jgi:CRP/FNR family transcriptional regulator
VGRRAPSQETAETRGLTAGELARLEATPLFRVLDAGRRERLRSRVRTSSYGAGQYLYFDAQSADALWAVRSGAVRLLRSVAVGRVTTLETLGPGDLFGLAALFPAGPYGETAEAVTATRVWRIARSELERVLGGDPALMRGVLGIVMERLARAHERLCAFAHASVPQRLAAELLAAPDGERTESTRRLLGERAGTTVETAIRVLRRFERAGWIEGGIGWVRILDRRALERIASGEDPGEEHERLGGRRKPG